MTQFRSSQAGSFNASGLCPPNDDQVKVYSLDSLDYLYADHYTHYDFNQRFLYTAVGALRTDYLPESITSMKQTSLGLRIPDHANAPAVVTRRDAPCRAMVRLCALVLSSRPEGKRNPPSLLFDSLLRIQSMQRYFILNGSPITEALYDVTLVLDFAGLDGWHTRLKIERTTLRLPCLLKDLKRAAQMLRISSTTCAPRC